VVVLATPPRSSSISSRGLATTSIESAAYLTSHRRSAVTVSRGIAAIRSSGSIALLSAIASRVA
jgi:hypothetical protein